MSVSPEHSAASLYCGEDAGDVASWEDDTWIPDHPASSTTDFPTDDYGRWISRLIDSELDYMPKSDYLRRPRDCSVNPTARQDAVNWMLEVHSHYQFRPVTAFLSVNYFDRFLSFRTLPEQQGNGGWPLQLLSVACLSLAAKMEEPSVPLLLDLQVSEPRFVFEPRTVGRMELLVMATLQWRLRSVTPFDFLDYFVTRLPSFGSSRYALLNRVFSSSSDLILNTSRVVDFLHYPPSAIAAAAVLLAAGQSVDSPEGEFYERVSREMVRSCRQLMEEYVVDTCPSARLKHVTLEPAPPRSPVGVLDAAACGSCDTQKSNSATFEPSQAEPTEEEPSIKRRKTAPSDVQQL